jgi:hypothetical protein
MLIFFAPIGCFLTWKYSTWIKEAKIVATVLSLIFFTPAFIGAVRDQSKNSTSDSQGIVANSTSTQSSAKSQREQAEQWRIEDAKQQRIEAAQAKHEAAQEAVKDTESHYITAMEQLSSDTNDFVNRLSDLFVNVNYDDDTWRIQVAGCLAYMQELPDKVNAIQVPTRFVRSNKLYKRAIYNLKYAGDNMPYALQNRDIESIHRCTAHIVMFSKLDKVAANAMDKESKN